MGEQLLIENGAPTLANLVNIAVQVILSYPAMKFWIMLPGKDRAGT